MSMSKPTDTVEAPPYGDEPDSAADERSGEPEWQRLLRTWWIREKHSLAVWPAIAVLFIVGMTVHPAFATMNNLVNVLQQASSLAILTLSMALILLTGRFDLSIESTLAFAPMIMASLIVAAPFGFSTEWHPFPGFIALFVIGAAIGAFNGYLVVGLKLNAFITTLAMLILLRGATLGVSGGRTVYSPGRAFSWLGSARVSGIPVAVVVTIVLYVVVAIFLNKHRIGRSIYAIGANEQAARAAGIPVDKIVFWLFIAGGMFASLAGLMMSGRIDSVVANQGQYGVLTVFAALAIGAFSLNGGKGTVLGALSGVLLLSMLSNILNLSNVPSYWVDASRGAIIIIALVLAHFASRTQGGET